MQVTLEVKHFGQLSETYREIWNMKLWEKDETWRKRKRGRKFPPSYSIKVEARLRHQ